MKTTLTLLLLALMPSIFVNAQCPTCGNGVVDAGETSANCPSDVSHNATCTSPCTQPGSAESSSGIRQAFDFTGTTTWSTSGLPAGWSFAGAPSVTTAGTLPVADTYGAKAGLIQPNCSGSCTSTNGFCIGNLANSVTVGSGGANGKLGANFDGRANINQNLSYAVLRGQSNPTLVSPTFNMSGVEGFKVQFWLFPSETSCGQSNSWGSCVGNAAYLDFSSNGGTSWTQILQMDISSTNTDMCINNSTNTKWLTESAWSRVCLTVYKSTTSPGNYYTAATGTTAASGIMVNSSYFTANFKFRIRYSQTASCTSGISTTNPGRYLAIDYPVITSGDEMIPCGISFANMCGYGLDDNDDGVGSTATTQTTAFSTVKRSVNQAERGVEILTSQTSAFASQNLSGSAFATNYDLCNAEGGDQQCIDWQSNNNFYSSVYECITDWEAPTSGINVNYYKGTTPQSFGLTKVTTMGKTASIGWRYSGSRIVSCGATSDLNSGCNGYYFLSNSLPTQFSRGFYGLSTNTLGQSWTYYGATSCNHYFNGPTFSPIAVPAALSTATNYTVCNGSDLVFTADLTYCSTSSFTGSPTISITGPGGFSETIDAGSTGTNPITLAGEYFLTGHTPSSPAQCLDCGRTVCVTVSQSEIDNCLSTPLPVGLKHFRIEHSEKGSVLLWETESEENSDYFSVERSEQGMDFTSIGIVEAKGNSDQQQFYQFTDSKPLSGISYYRLRMVDLNGSTRYSSIVSSNRIDNSVVVIPNPNTGSFYVSRLNGFNKLELCDLQGKVLETKETDKELIFFNSNQDTGIYLLRISNSKTTETIRVVVR